MVPNRICFPCKGGGLAPLLYIRYAYGLDIPKNIMCAYPQGSLKQLVLSNTLVPKSVVNRAKTAPLSRHPHPHPHFRSFLP